MFFKEEVKPRISDFDRNGSFTYRVAADIPSAACYQNIHTVPS